MVRIRDGPRRPSITERDQKHASRHHIEWPCSQRANFNAWVERVCAVVLARSTHESRRHLFKTLLDGAWKFSDWLTHAKRSHIRDAEAAVEVTESAVTLSVSVIIQHIRGVPDSCPACGAQQLSPERGFRENMPDVEWERPTCDDCGWAGTPLMIQSVPIEPEAEHARGKVDTECLMPKVPLRKLRKPGQEEAKAPVDSCCDPSYCLTKVCYRVPHLRGCRILPLGLISIACIPQSGAQLGVAGRRGDRAPPIRFRVTQRSRRVTIEVRQCEGCDLAIRRRGYSPSIWSRPISV